MTIKNRHGSRTQISWGEEITEAKALTGGTVTSNTVTGLSGMTADRYNGQMAFVMYRGGSVDGKFYHVVSNTATVLTFEENVASAGLAATDVLALTTVGKLPTTTTEIWAKTDETELPSQVSEYLDIFVHGDSNHPERTDGVETKNSFEATMPLKLVNGKLLVFALGYVKDVALTTGAVTTTNNRAVQIGELELETALATPTGFLADDYIEIGDDTGGTLNEGPEIRQITAVTPAAGKDLLTLDKPLRRFHPSGSAIDEVTIGGANTVTHTIIPNSCSPAITIEAVFKSFDPNNTVNDFVIHHTGINFKGHKLNSAEDVLNLEMSVVGLDELKNQRTRATLVTTDWTARPFIYGDSDVDINAISYSQIQNVAFGTDRGYLSKYYHNSNTGIKPFENIPEGFEHNCTMEIPLHNENFFDLIAAGTKFNAFITYTRTASTDLIKFKWDNTYLPEGKNNLSDRTEIITPLDLSVGNYSIEATDVIEYY